LSLQNISEGILLAVDLCEAGRAYAAYDAEDEQTYWLSGRGKFRIDNFNRENTMRNRTR
jgi:hypothetical protein